MPSATPSPVTRKRPPLRFILPLVFLLLVGSVWTFVAFAELRRMSPPNPNITLTQFAAAMPPPKHLAAIEHEGAPCIVWIGETARWSLPSGPACYVFDPRGNLILWNVSTGDGEPATPYCCEAYASDPLPLPNALASTTHPR